MPFVSFWVKKRIQRQNLVRTIGDTLEEMKSAIEFIDFKVYLIESS